VTPLEKVTAHLTATEALVDTYTAARARIILDGTSDTNIDQLRQQVDDAVLMVVTEWEIIQRPDQLAERIQALPGAHQATIEAHVDPDTDIAFGELVADNTWTPAPLDAHDTPPPYPIHTLPDWAQDHAQHVANQIQTPIDLTAMLIIGSLSAACTGRAKIKVSANWTEPVNLYLVTAMDSGAGKSAAEKLTCQWLRDWQRDRMDAVMDDYQLAKRLHDIAAERVKDVTKGVKVGSQHQDDLIEALRELDEAAMKIPELPRILADDATPEAVATLLAAHGERLAIMSTEADLFDMVLKGKQGTRVNFNVYLKAWSGDSLIRDRKGGSESGPEMTNLHHPLMTVACTVQPSVLARLSHDEEMANRGFSARFMMAMPEGRVGHRDQAMRFTDTRIPTTDIYNATASALADQWANWDKTEITVTDAARDELRAFLEAKEPQLVKGGRYEHLAEWSSKLYGSMARYAALLHLAEGHSPATPISHDTATRAVELADYWWQTADIILSMGDEVTEQARAILGWIDRSNVAEFKMRDVQRGVQRKSLGLDQAVDYVPALELLVEMGWLAPSEADWAVNVGRQGKSSGYFAVWSEPTTHSEDVMKVSCQSMGERESLPPLLDTFAGGPGLTPDIHDISDNPPVDNQPATTATDPVDNPDPDPLPDYSHVDF
jgi:replicative DNA helicase